MIANCLVMFITHSSLYIEVNGTGINTFLAKPDFRLCFCIVIFLNNGTNAHLKPHYQSRIIKSYASVVVFDVW